MEKPSRAMNIHLGADLKARWVDYCAGLGKTPGAAIKEAVEQQLEKAAKNPPPPPMRQTGEAPDDEPKVRFEILMTKSEKLAVLERSNLERCSQRRWIIDAIRAGLMCWSSFFGHNDRLFDCRLLLKGIGWQVAQFGVQPHAVVEANDVVGDVCHGLGVVGVVALPDPLRLEAYDLSVNCCTVTA